MPDNAIATVKTKQYQVALTGDAGPFRVLLSVKQSQPGLEYVTLRLQSPQPARPPALALVWTHAARETHLRWHPGCGSNRQILPEWNRAKNCWCKNTANAPVYALYRLDGRNALTFALSDALNVMHVGAGIVEESGEVECRIELFGEALPPLPSYETVLRLDTRPVAWYRAIGDVAGWWETLPGCTPAPVPEHARLPMYSSWYTFHQRLAPAELEEQCRLAKLLGMESVILDDGWQTDDNSRGYAYTGDWEVTPNKFPDFRAHVESVHHIGLKYLLWFSVPNVGTQSKAYKRFAGKYLRPPDHLGATVLDPRFPDVREYLVTLYERFVRDYNLDGLKLDFVDAFNPSDETRNARGKGRDMDSVPQAVSALLTEVMKRVRSLRPDILVEFRQSYIGPLMRTYGNMLRAGDVPNDCQGNRLNTIDVRLLAGRTPAHADMMMWHVRDPAESAAMQLVHTLFAVPQVSVRLDRIPPDHLAMVRFYLAFWRRHRDVLLDGEFMPQGPGMLYPLVCGRTREKFLAACYGAELAALPGKMPKTILLVNGTFAKRIVLDVAEDAGERQVIVTSCTGEVVRKGSLRLGPGLHAIELPPAGVAEFVG